MGYYINGIGTTFTEKITNLVERHGAEAASVEFQKNLVCLIDNGMFGAAGYCFNEGEFEAFKGVSSYKVWLIVPNADKLSGYKS